MEWESSTTFVIQHLSHSGFASLYSMHENWFWKIVIFLLRMNERKGGAAEVWERHIILGVFDSCNIELFNTILLLSERLLHVLLLLI